MFTSPIFTHHNATSEWFKSLPKQEVSTYTQTPNGTEIQVHEGLPTNLSPNATYDAISFQFQYITEMPWDRGQWNQYLVFDLPPTTSKHIQDLATICAGNLNLTFNSNNTTAPSNLSPLSSIQSAAAEMLSATGLSPITSPPLRTLLLTIAERASSCLLYQAFPNIGVINPNEPNNFTNPAFLPSLPPYLALVRHLALAGPPDTCPGLHEVTRWISKGWECGPFPPCAVQAALVKNKWRVYESRMFWLSLIHRQSQIDLPGMDVRLGEREMVDVLREIGVLEDAGTRAETLKLVATYATKELMRYVMVESGAVPVGSVSKRGLCWVLPAVVTWGRSVRSCISAGILSQGGNGVDLLRFLLDVRGEDGMTRVFDPNMVVSKTPDDSRATNPTALHSAIRCRNVNVARVLLEEGATMVPDFYGVTPLAFAKNMRDEKGAEGDQMRSDEIVKLLEAWLEERGFPWHHVDEPIVVGEETADL